MKIYKHILEEIIKIVPSVPPETGGILGGRNQIISHCAFDNGEDTSNAYDTYAPNIQMLNSTIKQWEKSGIKFYGIFHSHCSKAKELSMADKRYISRIMKMMPPQVGSLYFPIVIPEKELIVHRADIYGQKVHIIGDKIEII